MTVEETSSIIAAFATTFIAVAALGGTLVAALGLNSWRNKTLFEDDRNLARRVIVATLNLERVVYRARGMHNHGRMRSALRGELYHQKYPQTEEEEGRIETEINYLIFDRLSEEIDDAQAELEKIAIEADSLWDRCFERHLVPIRLLLIELRQCRERKLAISDRETSEISRESYLAINERERDCEFVELLDPDPFSLDFADAIQSCSDFLKLKLSGKKT